MGKKMASVNFAQLRLEDSAKLRALKREMNRSAFNRGVRAAARIARDWTTQGRILTLLKPAPKRKAMDYQEGVDLMFNSEAGRDGGEQDRILEAYRRGQGSVSPPPLPTAPSSATNNADDLSAWPESLRPAVRNLIADLEDEMPLSFKDSPR